MKNYYHLTKQELSYFSFIDEPLVSSISNKRLSTPVVVVLHNGRIVHVWTLKWFKSKVKRYPEELLSCFSYEIRSMY